MIDAKEQREWQEKRSAADRRHQAETTRFVAWFGLLATLIGGVVGAVVSAIFGKWWK